MKSAKTALAMTQALCHRLGGRPFRASLEQPKGDRSVMKGTERRGGFAGETASAFDPRADHRDEQQEEQVGILRYGHESAIALEVVRVLSGYRCARPTHEDSLEELGVEPLALRLRVARHPKLFFGDAGEAEREKEVRSEG